MNKIQGSMLALTIAYALAIVWIAIGDLTPFGLTIKIDLTAIPTLINGITTSTSIVIGVFVAILGIMYRTVMEKGDPKPKQSYLIAMVILMVPLFWLWTTYAFLTIGLPQFAIRYALSGLMTALYVCIVITVFTVTRIATAIDEESEKAKPEESNRAEPDKNKTTDQNKNVNPS